MTTGSFTSSRFAPSRTWARSIRAIAAALTIGLAGLFVVATNADARLGGGGSFGSRGSRTFSAPPSTSTAPSASPFQRSMTPNSGFSGNSGGFGGGFNRPASGGFFGGGGFGRGLVGGFLGAGLFGMLFGGGMTGGLGGGMSLIGLLLQLGLLYMGFRFIMGFFANRQQASYGGNTSQFGGAPQGGGFGGFQGSQPPAQPQGTPITIASEDYKAFEQRLVESQAAYSNGDVSALQRIATREMAGNFEQELRENDRQGVVNKLSDVRLLQGDLSEAWRENGSDYATVAMKFSLVDATVEKASGRIVSGNPQAPQEVTEVWTFQRPSGSGAQSWALSGIQQA